MQGEHVKEDIGNTIRYDELAEKLFHRRIFQSIQSTWLNEEHTSVFAKVFLPTSPSHKYNTFYFIHPTLFGDGFQLSRLRGLRYNIWETL